MQGLHPWWPEWLASVSPHLLFETLAYVVGYRLFAAQPATPDTTLDAALTIRLAVAAVLGGALGSKLSVLLDDPAAALADPLGPAGVLGGKSIVGGLLGGLAATEILKKSLGVTTSTGDRWVRSLWAGMATGRLGCFFAGVTDGTHGVVTKLPWGMDLGDGLPRHPTALYELCFLVGLGQIVERIPSRVPGDRFKFFLSSYLFFRLCIEEIKPVPTPWLGCSGIQVLCAAGLLYYAALMFRRMR